DVEAVYAWPVAVGNGWVEAEHGRLPVPAPATAILLEGVELATGGPVEGEATTPTGAALVGGLACGPPPGPGRRRERWWGAGRRPRSCSEGSGWRRAAGWRARRRQRPGPPWCASSPRVRRRGSGAC